MQDTNAGSCTGPSDLWASLQREAHEIAHKEPFLAAMLEHTLFGSDSLSDALARRLAQDLASAEMNEDGYQECLLDAFLADPSMIKETTKDLIAVHANDPACTSLTQAFLNYRGFHAVQTHRVANHFWRVGRRELATWLSNRVATVFGPDIHPAARLGAGLLLDHGAGIVIGETAIVEDDVTILQNVTLGGTGKVRGDRHPKVRQGAMIGAGANIIGIVEIGAFSKIGAGSVVLKDVPPGCTVAGVPAQIVRVHPKNEEGRDAISFDPDKSVEADTGSRRKTNTTILP